MDQACYSLSLSKMKFHLCIPLERKVHSAPFGNRVLSQARLIPIARQRKVPLRAEHRLHDLGDSDLPMFLFPHFSISFITKRFLLVLNLFPKMTLILAALAFVYTLSSMYNYAVSSLWRDFVTFLPRCFFISFIFHRGLMTLSS